MLTSCPECQLQISDKAAFCPHCGYPLKPEAKRYTKRSRRKRLPNGFGQISKIKGKNLRRPYRAMVNAGTSSEGRPITKLLKPVSYFETYNDAYAALVEYNKNPYQLSENLTVNELYTRWMTRKQKLISPGTKNQLDLYWKGTKMLHDIPVRELRAHHIKEWLETEPLAVTVKLRLKNVLNQLLDYAVEYEMTDRNYSKLVSVEQLSKDAVNARKSHISFTNDEMRILWANKDEPLIDIVLIECYTGLRPQELCLLRTKDVHLNEEYLVGGMKTEAGKNRQIPIHPSIRPIIAEYYEISRKEGREFLLFWKDFPKFPSGENLTYGKYIVYFQKAMQKLGLDESHRPHDCRKQFVTMAKKYQLDEYAIKRIIGHSIGDLTEQIYTDRPVSWLVEEVKKIRVDDYLAV